MKLRPAMLVVAGVSSVAIPSLRFQRSDLPSAVAREGPFADAIVETGTLTAAHMRLYSAPVGVPQSKIIELVAEGTLVGAGDRLIRFDTAALERDLARQASLVQEARADQVRAREELRVEQLRAQSDAAASRDRVDFAEQALANTVDGRGRVELAEANAAASQAAREAARARKAFEDLKPLLPQGFITRSELDRAEQTAVNTEAAATLANLRAQAIADFERPAGIAKARAELSTARDGLGRDRDMAAARLEQAAATVALVDGRVAEASSRMDGLKAQIAASVVTAEGPGFVIYRESFYGGEHRKPQVGDDVSPNQAVLAVPDTSRLIVETRVREIDVAHLAAGGAATARLDAIPDLEVHATVSLVGSLAIEDPARTGTRYFPVTVTLERTDPRLRPGMTARVEITSTTIARATVVPLQAVFDRSGDRFCVVFADGRWRKRSVAVTAVNETEAAIGAGVRPGDRVSLVDPDARP